MLFTYDNCVSEEAKNFVSVHTTLKSFIDIEMELYLSTFRSCCEMNYFSQGMNLAYLQTGISGVGYF